VALPFLDEKKWRNKAVKVFFAVLVVCGIFGEYEFSSEISQSAAELQRLSDGELTQAENNATVANDNARDAFDRATSTESQLASTRIQAARAERDAANAKASQQGVELELNQQREKTANAEKDLAQLQKAIATRRLVTDRSFRNGPPTQLDELKPFEGTRVFIQPIPEDAEAKNLALDIEAILKRSQWNPDIVDETDTGISGVRIPEGVLIERSEEDMKDRADLLASVLGKLGLNYVRVVPPRMGGGTTNPYPRKFQTETLYVLVGMRPITEELRGSNSKTPH
jgi:hypothetical protein